MKISERIEHAWNAFKGTDSAWIARSERNWWFGGVQGSRPDRLSIRPGTERSIIASLYNRIAIDVAAISIQHVRLDKNGHFKETISSGLNECLTHRANKDQSGRALIQDVVLTLCDEGSVAIVPVELPKEPSISPLADVTELRCGKILQWAPDDIQISLYNDSVGQRQDIWLPKTYCAIVENPLYAVMNEPNSTLRRLIHKLNLLDNFDDKIGSNKLDMVIQLPYTVRSELRKQQAQERLKEIEMQLTGSKYGVAYLDSNEHVTQLNRPIENNLLDQIDYNTQLLYSQLGLDETVFNGTADEKTMLNYYNRTIEPIISAISDALDIKFITKTARTQGQAIRFFRNPFKLVPVEQLAEIADKFTRNEILSSNEVRAIIGYKPVDDPRANQLRNANLNQNDNIPLADANGEMASENDESGVGSNDTVFK